MRKKLPPPYGLKAFTLSEVLITLVIIGVIAAITVPTLSANSRKEETTARLKKFYSTIQQVTYKAKADGNDWDYWAEEAIESVDNTPATSKEFAEKYVLPYIVYQSYKTVENRTYIYLNDGTYFTLKKGNCIDIGIDVNGEKKPNTGGRDKFLFYYCPKSALAYTTSKIIPAMGKHIKTRGQALELCKNNRDTCSSLLLFDGWEFKEDYPYHL